jgi:hypothetical protein
MAISSNGYKLGSVVICGGNTVHTFANSIACDGMSEAGRGLFLRETLAELVAGGLVAWELEPDYGNSRSIQPQEFTVVAFLADWASCFPSDVIRRDEVPDASNRTLTTDPLPGLARALDSYVPASA